MGQALARARVIYMYMYVYVRTTAGTRTVLQFDCTTHQPSTVQSAQLSSCHSVLQLIKASLYKQTSLWSVSDFFAFTLTYQSAMTLRTLLGKQTKTYCVVRWPEEENKLSVLSAKKIISLSQEDFAPDTFCKVKGFESHLCKIVAVASESEMKKKIAELDDETEKPPPKVRLRK